MDLPDERLVEASRRGDDRAYADLVGRHARRVFAICLALLGEAADAEDAVQDAFVRGFRKLPDLRDDARFGSWIGQIARNRCRDLLRRRARRPESPLTDAVAAATAAPEDGFAALRQALASLPEDHRLPLLLYYFDGKDTAALAAELGLSPAGACTRLHRARLRLRVLLEQEEATSHG